MLMAAIKGIVRYPSPPLNAMLTAHHIAAKELKWVLKKDQKDVELQLVPGGEILKGANTITRFLARSAPDAGLYGRDALSAAQVDMWLDIASQSTNVEEICDIVNGHLQLRTFLVRHEITIADLSVYGTLKTSSTWDGLVESKGRSLPHLLRWFNHIESLPQYSEVLSAHFSKSAPENAKTKVKGIAGWVGSYDLNLPNAKEGQVVTRFPPEPSGYLHLGHVKACMLNAYYATTYKGKLILRFDDTNPSKEKDEFTENIKEDLKTLGIVPDSISYTSDYFEKLEKYAEMVLKNGMAYVDNTPVEQMREERNNWKHSVNRDNSVEENLRLWEEMRKGTEEGLKCVLRAKIDMQNKNGALRDPSLYRCNLDGHYRTGKTFKVYPLYDFACPIVDSLEGVTHALRSSEYHDRNPLYSWVLEAVGVRKPHIEDFSRLNFEYVLLSKRKLQHFVNHKLVDNWDDPRFPTVQGVVRRGLTMEALREFILAQGASKNQNLMSMDKLWALNKKIIDPIVPRYTAITSEKRVPFVLTNGPASTFYKTVPRHKKNPSLGNKSVAYSSRLLLEYDDVIKIKQDEEVTLMDWGNAIVRKIERKGEEVVGLEGELHLEGDFKTTEKKLTWLSDSDELVPVVLKTFGYLITKKKLEENDDFTQFINKDSLKVTNAVGDSSLRLLNKGDKIQLERKGYYIVDSPFVATSSKAIVLHAIPEGKADEQPAKK